MNRLRSHQERGNTTSLETNVKKGERKAPNTPEIIDMIAHRLSHRLHRGGASNNIRAILANVNIVNIGTTCYVGPVDTMLMN